MDIKELRRKRLIEWFSDKTLPEKDKSYISQITTGRSGLGEKGAKRLEADYNMPPGYLVSPADDAVISPLEYIGTMKSGIVPVRGDASLGVDGAIDMTERNEGWLRAYSRDPNAYAIHTSGDSMWPRIKSGDYVLIEPGATVLPGDEVFVRTKDGHNMIKVLGYDREGEYQFVSINQDHRPATYRHADIEKIEFVAGIFKKTLYMDDDEAREHLRA